LDEITIGIADYDKRQCEKLQVLDIAKTLTPDAPLTKRAALVRYCGAAHEHKRTLSQNKLREAFAPESLDVSDEITSSSRPRRPQGRAARRTSGVYIVSAALRREEPKSDATSMINANAWRGKLAGGVSCAGHQRARRTGETGS